MFAARDARVPYREADGGCSAARDSTPANEPHARRTDTTDTADRCLYCGTARQRQKRILRGRHHAKSALRARHPVSDSFRRRCITRALLVRRFRRTPPPVGELDQLHQRRGEHPGGRWRLSARRWFQCAGARHLWLAAAQFEPLGVVDRGQAGNGRPRRQLQVLHQQMEHLLQLPPRLVRDPERRRGREQPGPGLRLHDRWHAGHAAVVD